MFAITFASGRLFSAEFDEEEDEFDDDEPVPPEDGTSFLDKFAAIR